MKSGSFRTLVIRLQVWKKHYTEQIWWEVTEPLKPPFSIIIITHTPMCRCFHIHYTLPLPSCEAGSYLFFMWTTPIPGGSGGIKNLPTTQEPQVWSQGWEDLLEEEMAVHFRILPWDIAWMEEPGGLQSMGLQKSQTRLND